MKRITSHEQGQKPMNAVNRNREKHAREQAADRQTRKVLMVDSCRFIIQMKMSKKTFLNDPMAESAIERLKKKVGMASDFDHPKELDAIIVRQQWDAIRKTCACAGLS